MAAFAFHVDGAGLLHHAVVIVDAGQAAGLLPNDFLEVVSKGRPEYFRAFETAESSGALAWGLSGSGSAFFMVFDDGELSRRAISLLDREDWVIKTTELE